MASVNMLKILVIGATSAIATACARLWVIQGATFFLVGRTAKKLGQVADDLTARGAIVHTHVLDLKAPTPDCAGASFEVDLPSSAKNTGFDANYPWSIKGNKIEVDKVPAADLGDAGVENIVSFTIKPILDAQQQPTHLCVTVVDKI